MRFCAILMLKVLPNSVTTLKLVIEVNSLNLATPIYAAKGAILAFIS